MDFLQQIAPLFGIGFVRARQPIQRRTEFRRRGEVPAVPFRPRFQPQFLTALVADFQHPLFGAVHRALHEPLE
jgi:hypothetical protein